MPRPKVRPEDRQRVRKACLPCKTSKKRCDGKPVCSTCAGKNPSLCVYPTTPASPSHNEETTSPVVQMSRQNEHQRQNSAFGFGPNASSPSVRKPSDAQNDITRSPEALHMTHSRMLQNLKGDQVYIGDAASLSFLQLLRQTFTRHMGPSRFTDNQRRDIMLEAERRSEAPSLLTGRHHLNQKRALVESYFTATAGIFHIYSKPAVLSSLELVDINEEIRPSQYAGFCLVIAIGGQCRAQSSSDIHYEQVYFTRGQEAAFKDMLEDPSLDLVRNFLLMAFYMLGACRRNAAFMYLGVAARAAHALGFHDSNSYNQWSPEDRNIRLQTWKSLRILDLIVSSILGRPTATTTQQIRSSGDLTDIHTPSDDDFPPAVEATYRVCIIMNEILHKIYPDKSVSAVAAEEILERLGLWSANLPPELRVSSTETFPGSPGHDHVVGGLHVACSYYFAVMLVTRPFLVIHSMSRLPETSGRSSRSVTGGEVNEADNTGPGMLKLAQVCVDSAMFLAQTCHDALQAGLMLNNMCLVKAWIFAAGLIIGFSMFTHSEAKPELEDSLRGAREVLQQLSNHSPQAGHYHDIITSLSEAIAKHREQVKARRRRVTSRYVDRIFSFGSDVTANQQFPTIDATDSGLGLHSMDMTFDGSGDQTNIWGTEGPTIATDPEAPLGPSQGVFPDWDSFALPFFDTFSMESDLLPMFAEDE